MAQTAQVNIEDLFTKLLNWEDNKKDLVHWIFSLAVQLKDPSFFHRAKVLQYCSKEDFEALKNLFDNNPLNISFRDMKGFIKSEDFVNWLEGMKDVVGDRMFIFLITFLLSFHADAEGRVTADASLNNYLANKPESKLLFLTLSAILRREYLKKQSQ